MPRLYQLHNLLNTPHEYRGDDEDRGDDGEGLVIGDLVRYRRRRAPGRTVYWLADGEHGMHAGGRCLRIVSLPDGGEDPFHRLVPTPTMDKLERCPPEEAPSWLVLRSLGLPAWLREKAERGDPHLTPAEKHVPEVTRADLRRHAAALGVPLRTSAKMSDEALVEWLTKKGAMPAMLAPRPSPAAPVLGLDGRPEVLAVLSAEEAFSLEGAVIGLPGAVNLLMRKVRQLETTLAETINLHQASAATTRELETARMRVADREEEISVLQGSLSDLRAAMANSRMIEITTEVEEALRIGREVMRQRAEPKPAGRFNLHIRRRNEG